MLSVTQPAPGVRQLDFNRPDKHNALNSDLYHALAASLREAQDDHGCRAMVLSATGKSFCAGNDLAEFESSWPQPVGGAVATFLVALYACDVPVIAAVQGAAIGIGATLLLHCDVIYAAPASYLRFPFVDLGIVLEGGSSHLLLERLGRPRAMEILLSGRKVPAAEAATLGLVSSVTETPTEAALVFAAQLAAKSAEAIRATKRLARRSLESILPARFDEELQAVNRLLQARAKTGP